MLWNDQEKKYDAYFLVPGDRVDEFIEEYPSMQYSRTVLMYCIIWGLPDAYRWNDIRRVSADSIAEKYGMKLVKEDGKELYYR